MTIQMTQSAASIAAVSSNATLVNLSKTQAETFNLNASTMKASLQANETMAESDSKAILDAANASQAEAIGSFSGAIAGGAITGGGMLKGLGFYNEAQNLQKQSETLRTNVTPVAPKPAAPSELVPPAEEKPAPIITPENVGNNNNNLPPAAPKQEAELVVEIKDGAAVANETTQPVNEGKIQADKLAREQAEKAEKDAKAIEDKAKGIRSQGDTWMQTANTFGPMVSTVASSSGKLAGYNYQVDQAHQTKIKDTENGVSSTLNTLASLIGQQLGNLDQSRSAISQMIQGLYVRQG